MSEPTAGDDRHPASDARDVVPRGLFRNLGTTLQLMRGLRRRSQGWVAREAGIGKGQLSKYETGRELPKLESLSKVLAVLEVGHLEFFYTLHFIDQQGVAGGLRAPFGPGVPGGGIAEALLRAKPPLGAPSGSPRLHAAATEQAFTTVLADLLQLYRHVFEELMAVAPRGQSSQVSQVDQKPELAASTRRLDERIRK